MEIGSEVLPLLLAAFAGGRRAMKGPADSPKVSLTGEDFRSAETWEYADDSPGTYSTAWAKA